jgi:hypothetical protein
MNITTGLEDIRQQHQSIVNLLSSVNPILQHVVGGFYAMGIPIICCMLHGLSSGTISLDDLYRMIFTILGNHKIIPYKDSAGISPNMIAPGRPILAIVISTNKTIAIISNHCISKCTSLHTSIC